MLPQRFTPGSRHGYMAFQCCDYGFAALEGDLFKILEIFGTAHNEMLQRAW